METDGGLATTKSAAVPRQNEASELRDCRMEIKFVDRKGAYLETNAKWGTQFLSFGHPPLIRNMRKFSGPATFLSIIT